MAANQRISTSCLFLLDFSRVLEDTAKNSSVVHQMVHHGEADVHTSRVRRVRFLPPQAELEAPTYDSLL